MYQMCVMEDSSLDFNTDRGIREPTEGTADGLLLSKRPTNPFLSGSVVWSPVSSGFQIPHDEVVHERLGAVVA